MMLEGFRPAQIKNLALAITQLNDAQAKFGQLGMNIGSFGSVLDSQAIQGYANALGSVNTQQAAYLLSSQGVQANLAKEILLATGASETEVDLALSKQGLIATNRQVTSTELESAMASIGASDVLKAEASETLGLTVAKGDAAVATTILTKEELMQKLATLGLSETDQQAIATKLGFVAAEGTATVGVKAFTQALWQQTTAMISWMATNPIGWIMAIGAAIGIVTSAVNKYNQSQEETRQKTKELADQVRETSKEIFDLYNQYNELSEAVLTDASNKEQLTSVTDALLEKLGYEKSAVQDLVDEYGNLDDAIKNITIKELQDQQGALISDYSLKKDNLLDDSNSFSDYFYADSAKQMTIRVGIDYLYDKPDPILEDVFKTLTDSNLFAEVSNSTLKLKNTNETLEGVLANYDAISEAIDLLRDKYDYELLGGNKVFTSLVSQQTNLKTKIDEYNTAVSSLNENVAREQILFSLIGREIPYTVDEFESYKDTLINSALANDSFVGTEEDIRKAIESSLASMPEFAKFFEVTADTVKQDTIPSIEDLTSAYTALSEALDEIYGKQDKLTDAFSKVVSGVKLTRDEILELVDTFPDILPYIQGGSYGYTVSMEGLQIANSNLNEQARAEAQNIINSYETAQRQIQKLQTTPIGNSSDALQNYSKIKQLQDYLDASKDIYDSTVLHLELLQDGFANHDTVLKALETRYADATSAIDNYNSSIKTIDSAIEKMNEGQALSYDEMIELVEISPSIKNAIKTSTDGYRFEIEALNELRKATKESRNDTIDAEIEKTRVTLVETQDRITLIKSELTTLYMLGASAFTINDERRKQLTQELADAKSEFDQISANLIALQQRKEEHYNSSSGGGSGKDQIVEAFEKELKYLDYLRDMGMISAKEYYKQLYFLNEKYYSDNEKYLEQYRDNEVKIRDGIVDIEIRAIDRQIEALELLKEKREEEKELQELQVELEEKKLELLNKQSQKNVRYYDAEKREWIWTHNRNDVVDAQKAVDEAQQALDEHLYQSNEDKKIEQLEQIKEILQGDEDNPNNATQWSGKEGVTTQATARKVTAEEFYARLGLSQKVDTTALMRSVYAMGLQPNVQKIAESTHNQNISTVNRNIQGNQFTVNIDGSGLSTSELEKVVEDGFNEMFKDLVRQMSTSIR